MLNPGPCVEYYANVQYYRPPPPHTDTHTDTHIRTHPRTRALALQFTDGLVHGAVPPKDLHSCDVLLLHTWQRPVRARTTEWPLLSCVDWTACARIRHQSSGGHNIHGSSNATRTTPSKRFVTLVTS